MAAMNIIDLTPAPLEPIEEIAAADGQTRKVLFRLADGKTIESALMFFKNPDTGRELPVLRDRTAGVRAQFEHGGDYSPGLIF